MTVRGGAGAVAPPVASTLLTASWRWSSGERSCAQLIAKQPPHSRLGRCCARARQRAHAQCGSARSVKRDWRLGPAAAARPEREMDK